MLEYDSQCTSRTNWFHEAGTHCTNSEPGPGNTFVCIEGLMNSEIEEPLPAYFWEQSDTPSPWNLYWTEAAACGGGLEIDDLVIGNSWTRYWGAHSSFTCDPDIPSKWEGQGSGATHETEGRAPAATETIGIPEIVITPPTYEPTEWHW
jgi:hypothetical protein